MTSSRARRALQSPAIRSAIRLTLAMILGNALLIRIFGETAPATQGSFAIVILLLLLDYDGTARERLLSYLAASAIGAAIVALGVAVSPWPWVAVIVTIPVMFTFAFARVLKGFIARSAVGLPLAFFLPVMTGVPMSSMGVVLEGWLIGCAVAIAFAMLVLPRHHTGMVRRAMAHWCNASADYIEALSANAPLDEARAALDTAYGEVHASIATGFDRPGALASRLRALLQLANVTTTTYFVAQVFTTADRPRHAEILAGPSVAAFRAAARLVSLDPGVQPVPDLVADRSADLDSARIWSVRRLMADGGAAAVADLRAHYPVRLSSIAATTAQWLAGTSAGRHLPPPDIGYLQTSTPTELLRGNLTFQSPWLRNALRTAVAAAVAVAIAKALGLQHGFWVVMATLSLIQTTFSSSSSSRRAWQDAAGGVAGVVVGALLVTLAANVWIFAIILAVAAFASKAAPSRWPALTQFIFSIFVIANVTLLTWPPTVQTAEYRLIDILVGSGVAIALTLVIFPRGINGLIDRTRAEAIAAVGSYVELCRSALIAPVPDLAVARQQRQASMLTVVRFGDALDAGYMARDSSDARYAALLHSDAMLRDSLVAGDAMLSLTRDGERPADVPGLAQLLSTTPSERQIAEVADAERDAIAAHPQSLASTVWAGWWLQYLDAAKRELAQA